MNEEFENSHYDNNNIKIVSLDYKQLVLVFLIILGFVFYLKNGIVNNNQITKWEYTTLDFYPQNNNDRIGESALGYNSVTCSKTSLNSMGEKGWELVSTYLETETSFPNLGDRNIVDGIRSNIRPQRVVCIFKRKLVKIKSEF